MGLVFIFTFHALCLFIIVNEQKKVIGITLVDGGAECHHEDSLNFWFTIEKNMFFKDMFSDMIFVKT